MIERVIQGKLLRYVESTGNVEILQLAYKATIQLRQHYSKSGPDILNAIQTREIACLILLDLSVAFDTIDHHLLLNHLKYRFGIEDKVLLWIQPILSPEDREMVITREDCPEPVYSESIPLEQGVPQGSVLGPQLFSLYICLLGHLCRETTVPLLCWRSTTLHKI